MFGLPESWGFIVPIVSAIAVTYGLFSVAGYWRQDKTIAPPGLTDDEKTDLFEKLKNWRTLDDEDLVEVITKLPIDDVIKFSKTTWSEDSDQTELREFLEQVKATIRKAKASRDRIQKSPAPGTTAASPPGPPSDAANGESDNGTSKPRLMNDTVLKNTSGSSGDVSAILDANIEQDANLLEDKPSPTETVAATAETNIKVLEEAATPASRPEIRRSSSASKSSRLMETVLKNAVPASVSSAGSAIAMDRETVKANERKQSDKQAVKKILEEHFRKRGAIAQLVEWSGLSPSEAKTIIDQLKTVDNAGDSTRYVYPT